MNKWRFCYHVSNFSLKLTVSNMLKSEPIKHSHKAKNYTKVSLKIVLISEYQDCYLLYSGIFSQGN